MYAVGAQVVVFDIVDDSPQSGVDPTPGHVGEAWLVSGWATRTDGHIVVWDGRSWSDRGLLADGMIVVVNGSTLGTPGGSFAAFDGKVLRYKSWSGGGSPPLGWSAWSLYGSNASTLIVASLDPAYRGQMLVWNVVAGWTRMIGSLKGATAGDIVTLDAQGAPQDSGYLLTSMAVKDHPLTVHRQDAEPTLGSDDDSALWVDTNDSNRVWLVFRRGTGDQIKVELSV